MISNKKSCQKCKQNQAMLRRKQAKAAKPFQRSSKLSSNVISNNKKFFK